MEVEKLTEDELGDWDLFLDDLHEPTLFQTTYWLSTSEWEFDVYGAFQNRRLVGGLAVPHQTTLRLRYAANPLLTPYLGPVFDSFQGKPNTVLSKRKKILGEITDELYDRFSYVSFPLSPSRKDVQAFLRKGFDVEVRYTYLVDIGDIDEAWSRMDKTRRTEVRKARDMGATVDQSDDLETTLELAHISYQRGNGETENWADLKEASRDRYDALRHRDRAKCFVTELDGDPLASIYLVHENDYAYYLLGGRDHENGIRGDSTLALWTAMEYAAEEHGAGTFDLRGSMIPSIEQYFRKFGGVLTPYYTVTWTKPYLHPAIELYKRRKLLHRLFR